MHGVKPALLMAGKCSCRSKDSPQHTDSLICTVQPFLILLGQRFPGLNRCYKPGTHASVGITKLRQDNHPQHGSGQRRIFLKPLCGFHQDNVMQDVGDGEHVVYRVLHLHLVMSGVSGCQVDLQPGILELMQ
jgi:hypothetical protein